ncbi:MAG: QsdR family transcriptional regulator [Jiangellales bacterium]
MSSPAEVTPARAVVQARRPRRDDAIDVAEQMLRRGERVDMQTVADALDIGRATLYRWVGDREKLMDEVLGRLVAKNWRTARVDPDGESLDAVLATIAGFMAATAAWPPVLDFAEREPDLALRILLAAQGNVADGIRLGLEETLALHLPGRDVAPATLDVLVRIGAALQWANVAAGNPPDIDTAVEAARALLTIALAAPRD